MDENSFLPDVLQQEVLFQLKTLRKMFSERINLAFWWVGRLSGTRSECRRFDSVEKHFLSGALFGSGDWCAFWLMRYLVGVPFYLFIVQLFFKGGRSPVGREIQSSYRLYGGVRSWRIESSSEFKTLSFWLDIFLEEPPKRFFKSHLSAAFWENCLPRWFHGKIRSTLIHGWTLDFCEKVQFLNLVRLLLSNDDD